MTYVTYEYIDRWREFSFFRNNETKYHKMDCKPWQVSSLVANHKLRYR